MLEANPPFDFERDSLDPLEEMEIEDALEEMPEGNKRFKRLMLMENIKQRKYCQRTTGCFHGRIQTMERKVFAWKYQMAGIVAACVVLIPVIGYLLVKVLKW